MPKHGENTERGKMVVGRVALLKGEKLTGPQSGDTFMGILTLK